MSKKNIEDENKEKIDSPFLKFGDNKSILLLFIIGSVGITIRLVYFPFDLPVIFDGVDYFSYAVVTSQQGQLPYGWSLTNNGWSIFLSVFFSILDSSEFLDFIYLQRFLSIIISVLTIIPVYLLCNRFVEKQYAIIGAALFLFDPRIIINSELGVTEPAFILLGSLSLFLFLSKNFRVVISSFFVLGLFVMIRYEGFLVIFPFLIMFFVRYRKDKKILLKILLVIGIFAITILPMGYARYVATGEESIILPIFYGGTNYISTIIIQGIPDEGDLIYGTDSGGSKLPLFITLGLVGLVKYLGWVMIPSFVFFVPVGFFLILQNRDHKTITIFLVGITMLITAFYAYGRGIEETRYLYVTFPILCIMSSFTIKKIGNKFRKQNLMIGLLLIGIIVSSIIFLDFKKIDIEYEKESYLIAKDVVRITEGINHYAPDSKWIQIAEVANNWPKIPLPNETSYNQSFEIKKISPENYSSLENYIKNSKEKGLTHIVANGKEGNPEFINDVFEHEGKYPYLTKEYDSLEQGFSFQIKIYKIDYLKFQNLYNEI